MHPSMLTSLRRLPSAAGRPLENSPPNPLCGCRFSPARHNERVLHGTPTTRLTTPDERMLKGATVAAERSAFVTVSRKRSGPEF